MGVGGWVGGAGGRVALLQKRERREAEANQAHNVFRTRRSLVSCGFFLSYLGLVLKAWADFGTVATPLLLLLLLLPAVVAFVLVLSLAFMCLEIIFVPFLQPPASLPPQISLSSKTPATRRGERTEEEDPRRLTTFS